MRKRIRVGLLLWAGLALMALVTRANAGILDQEHSVQQYHFGAAAVASQSLAQTFTVGFSGTLDRLELQLWRDATATLPLTAEFRLTLTTGEPDLSLSGLLASLNWDTSTIPTTPFTTQFSGMNLGQQAFAVDAGQVLAIVLTSPTSFPAWYLWETSDSAATPPAPQYVSGQAYVLGTFGGLRPESNQDRGFRTYVTIPEFANLPILIIPALLALRRANQK